MRALHERAVQGDWVSPELLFPSSRMQRQAWRRVCEAIDAALLERGLRGLPALIPGLVHARLATALLAAGYRSKQDLQARKIYAWDAMPALKSAFCEILQSCRHWEWRSVKTW